MESLQVPRPFKPRRPHKKSRNGCKYCRRRRIKCDESKPSCLRCLNRNQPCEYFPQAREYETLPDRDPSPFTQGVVDVPDDMLNIATITPSPSLRSGLHTPVDGSPPSSTHLNPLNVTDIFELNRAPRSLNQINQAIMKDMYLFDHYIDHTCHDLEIMPEVAFVKRYGLPQLAAENQGILCSLMALGAACLSIDHLTGQDCGAHTADLGSLITAGDRYHRLGMQALRQQMNSTQPRDLAEAHAHSIMLFPYALARRRISHLLSDVGPPTPTSGVETQEEHLNSVGWMIILRGVTTTGRAWFSNRTLYPHSPNVSDERDQLLKVSSPVSSQVLAKVSEPGDRPSLWAIFPYRIAPKHPLFPVVSATRGVALEALQHKVESLNQMARDYHRRDAALDVDVISRHLAQSTALSACLMAVDLLLSLDSTIFNPSSPRAGKFSVMSATTESLFQDSSIPWLKDYARLPAYDPASPALRTVFAWVNSTPEEYFQLLLKPLPAEKDFLGGFVEESGPQDIDRKIQLLAWDIWAHWLVFAILIEGESFFTASLGVPDIANLAPYFRNSTTTSPGSNVSMSPPSQDQDWWPWSMSSVAQQLRRYDGEGTIN